MTDKKISELTSITGADVSDANDVLPIVDTNVATTKKITRAELFKSVSSVDINGGTIDGVTIGGASAGAATFTSATVNGNIAVTGTVDGRDVATDGTKLDGIEAGADVTDTTNVTAAGALMDSELTNITAVKALDQGVATTDSPSFAGITATTADINGGTIDDTVIGGSTPAAISGTTGSFSGNLTVDTNTLFVDAANNRVGIGTSSPSAKLQVAGATQFGAVGVDGAVQFLRSSDGGAVASIAFQSGTSEVKINNAISGPMTFYTNNTEAMRIDSSGNLLLGGSITPASATDSLAIFNGTAPTGSVTNGVVLYAEDVSSSSELKVRDEAGNVTTLSPHNFDLIPEGPSEDMAWSYYSERDGKRINVDMLKAIRILEQLSGEKLVHMV